MFFFIVLSADTILVNYCRRFEFLTLRMNTNDLRPSTGSRADTNEISPRRFGFSDFPSFSSRYANGILRGPTSKRGKKYSLLSDWNKIVETIARFENRGNRKRQSFYCVIAGKGEKKKQKIEKEKHKIEEKNHSLNGTGRWR